MTKSVRVVFVGAMSLYAFVGVSNVLEHAGITAFFDLYEDFAEILFVPALAYVASTMYQNQQIDSQQKAARVMRQQNDLLLNIVDTVPGGILVVGPTGAVTFANEGAERLLGMTSDSGGSVSITPSWTLLDPRVRARRPRLRRSPSGGTLTRTPLFARWPDGTQTGTWCSARRPCRPTAENWAAASSRSRPRATAVRRGEHVARERSSAPRVSSGRRCLRPRG